jgi:branched-chain amino acid transport system permease protein
MFWSLLLIGLASGVLVGLVLALVSTGFNMSLGVSRVVNFQHGGMILWGMYSAFYFWKATQLNPYLVLIVLIPAAFAVGYAMHRLLIVQSLRTPEDSQILFSLGLLIAFQYLAQFVFTTDARSISSAQLNGSLIMGPVILQYSQIIAGGVALIILIGMHLMLAKSDIGRFLHACAQNPTGARVSGLNVAHISGMAMGLAAATAAICGVTLATLTPVIPGRAFEYAILAAVVSVFGGMGSMVGSIAGGLVVGIIVSICQAFGYETVAQALVYALVFLIFLVRPTGLAGGRA